MTSAALTRRWTPEHVDGLTGQAVEQARHPRPPHHLASPWGEVDGRTDLRGFAFPSGFALAYLTLADLDLGGARGRVLLHEVDLTGCSFDGTRSTTQGALRRSFTACTFRGARLPGVRLGGAFTDCDLDGAHLRGALTTGTTTFTRCRIGADLTGAVLRDARFVDCDFTGLTTSWQTTFERCTFVGGVPDVGDAQVRGATVDGARLPDRWRGEGEAGTAWDALLDRYRATPDDDTLPLEPEA
ncbi:pentapeptide repeat-containing protein [Cellulomonas triticagri]|uniref:Pentapeptide repeat-containing protein n=1 Tax=Cellulomonas triticagri TaxID=2483352 RepID=A0A3M2J9Y2_9CELL|nr:pentapeptide repeat-containing protein [Cellulomonas triticagri]RMI09774.1 pentapeptide repeat-containing protein [Cellulomonas triticagri]